MKCPNGVLVYYPNSTPELNKKIAILLKNNNIPHVICGPYENIENQPTIEWCLMGPYIGLKDITGFIDLHKRRDGICLACSI
jgi:hypothetical protein